MKTKYIPVLAILLAFICLLTACSFPNIPNKDTSDKSSSVDFSKYEDLDVFEQAKSYGYEISEYDFSPYYYAVFSINGTSIMISNKHSSAGDIGLFNCVLTKSKINLGTFSYFSTFYSDSKADERNEFGHWIFTNEHKYELITLLKNYSQIGIKAFATFFSNASSYMDNNYRALIDSKKLSAYYQKVDSKYYRFIFFDDTGKAAWFVAEYTEADIEKDENAYGLNKWENYTGEISGLTTERFSKDYVKKDGILHSTEDRIDELSNFFNG